MSIQDEPLCCVLRQEAFLLTASLGPGVFLSASKLSGKPDGLWGEVWVVMILFTSRSRS